MSAHAHSSLAHGVTLGNIISPENVTMLHCNNELMFQGSTGVVFCVPICSIIILNDKKNQKQGQSVFWCSLKRNYTLTWGDNAQNLKHHHCNKEMLNVVITGFIYPR